MKSIEQYTALLKNIGGYIDGGWETGSKRFDVRNPATGELLAEVAELGREETMRAIGAAEAALKIGTTVEQRRGWLMEIARRLEGAKGELAKVITMEQGKPLKESVAEVEYAAGFFTDAAGRMGLLAPRVVGENIRGARWVVRHRAAGVVGIITPWNFPIAMMAKKIAPQALAAGCAMVVKPAELTPLTAIAFWNLIADMGMPKGTMNLVTGAPAAIGEALMEHSAVRLVSFTGSTGVGKKLIAQSAAGVKRVALELGGNAPFIVFEDADVGNAVKALMMNKFRCAGQTCVCANRVLVQRGVEEAFLRELAPRVEGLKVGNGMEAGVEIGPLINKAGWEKVDGHVRDALAKGAEKVAGKAAVKPGSDWGYFYPPTVLRGVTPGMDCFKQEMFGPVVAVTSFESVEEAIELANGTEYGLAAYVFSADAGRTGEVAGRLKFGHVGVNTGTGPAPHAPFGGFKQSGFGREGGDEGLLEYCEVQTVAEGF